MVPREKIASFLEKLILVLCGLLIFLRLFLFWFLISYTGPDNPIDKGLLLDLPTEFIGICVYIIFFIFLIKLIIQRRAVNLNIPITIFLLGLLIWSSLSLIYSVNIDSTLRFIWEFLAYIYLFFILFDCLNAPRRIDIFIYLLIAAALVTSIFGLYHYFSIYQEVLKRVSVSTEDYRIINFLKLRRVTVFFGWPNQLAGFLSMLLPLGVVGALLTRDRREKLYIALSCAALFFCSVSTYSIGGLLSEFIAGVIAIVLYLSKGHFKINLKSKKIKLAIAMVILLVFISALAITHKRADKMTEGSFIARTIYLKGTISIIKDNPIFGTGAGTFKDIFSAYIKRPIEYARHTHNSFLEFWSDLGIAGFLLFLTFSVYILYSIGMRLKKENQPKKRLLLAGLFCSIAAFLIHNMVDFTLFAPMVSFYWWVIVSLAFAAVGSMPSATKRNFVIKRIFISCGALSFVVAFVFLLRQFAADAHFFKAESYKNNSQKIEEVASNLEISKRLNPFDYRYAKSLGDLYVREFTRSGKGVFRDKAIEEYKQASQLYKKVLLYIARIRTKNQTK